LHDLHLAVRIFFSLEIDKKEKRIRLKNSIDEIFQLVQQFYKVIPHFFQKITKVAFHANVGRFDKAIEWLKRFGCTPSQWSNYRQRTSYFKASETFLPEGEYLLGCLP
jgi:hypothetical protein